MYILPRGYSAVTVFLVRATLLCRRHYPSSAFFFLSKIYFTLFLRTKVAVRRRHSYKILLYLYGRRLTCTDRTTTAQPLITYYTMMFIVRIIVKMISEHYSIRLRFSRVAAKTIVFAFSNILIRACKNLCNMYRKPVVHVHGNYRYDRKRRRPMIPSTVSESFMKTIPLDSQTAKGWRTKKTRSEEAHICGIQLNENSFLNRRHYLG